jgi:predicted dithiol-disulfide oxidoreductase (DUF899 family)
MRSRLLDTGEIHVTATPPIVDRDTWLKERAVLLAREKAHTREGDAIAAARRRLPMTEVPNVMLEGDQGPTPLLDLFQGRDQLVVYKHMFHVGEPFEGQCPGCTLSQWNVQDATYLNEEGVSYAVVAEGPWDEVRPFRDFMGYTQPWYAAYGIDDPVFGDGFGSVACFLRVDDRIFLTYETTDRGVEAIMATLKILDMTVYGRQEEWEDSPDGWPQRPTFSFWMREGRPTGQWSRPAALASTRDDMGRN